MTINTITVNSTNFVIYATVSEADTYAVINNMTVWTGMTTQAKELALLSATKTLDRFKYVGTKVGNDAVQVNQFPRNGVTYLDGTPFGNTDVPAEIAEVCCLIAFNNLTKGKDTEQDVGQLLRKLKTGNSEIEFFARSKEVDLFTGNKIEATLSKWLASSRSYGNALADWQAAQCKRIYRNTNDSEGYL